MRTVFGRTQIDSILRKTFCKITTPLEVTRFELCDGKTREIPLFWPRIEIPGRWIQRAAVVAFVHERFIHFSNVEERQRILGPGFLSVALTTIMYSLYLSFALYKSILGSFSSRYTHVEVSGSRRNMWKKTRAKYTWKKPRFPTFGMISGLHTLYALLPCYYYSRTLILFYVERTSTRRSFQFSYEIQ